jgi:hypothetical protein
MKYINIKELIAQFLAAIHQIHKGSQEEIKAPDKPMHKITIKNLSFIPALSFETLYFNTKVCIDGKNIGTATKYSTGETIFNPNTDGKDYLTNFISERKLIELIDKAVYAAIAERKAIFINAKDNTMSYISPDADESIRKKLIFYGYKFKYVPSCVDYEKLETECFSADTETEGIFEAEVDKDGPHNPNDLLDFGFFFVNIGFGGYDYDEIFWDFRSDMRDSGWPDGSYRDMIICSKYSSSSTFIGNAIIKTNKSIEQLSNEVKCFHIEDKGSGPTIVEHNSNPKIITLDDFLI